jgi:flagellar basal-body rod protein FlgG
MIQGLYASANGMMAVEDRQAVIANNIANASSPGFKRQLAVQKGYYKAYFGEIDGVHRLNADRAPGGGLKTTQTFTDYSDGVIKTTGRDLDIALVGPGFLEVNTPRGERYTRSGKLAASSEGDLVTDHGYTVMSVDGEAINIAGGPFSIDSEGFVRVGGDERGQIRVVEFVEPHMLNRAGYSLYQASDEALELSGPGTNTVIAPQSLETSNVQLPSEVTHMIMAMRAYAANQNVINAIDQTASRMIDQVGAP